MLQRELLSGEGKGRVFIEKPTIRGYASNYPGLTYACGEFAIACTFNLSDGDDKLSSAEIQFSNVDCNENVISATKVVNSWTVVASTGEIKLVLPYNDLPAVRSCLRARLIGEKYGPSPWSDFIQWNSAGTMYPC